jgi:hypothetical protein
LEKLIAEGYEIIADQLALAPAVGVAAQFIDPRLPLSGAATDPLVVAATPLPIAVGSALLLPSASLLRHHRNACSELASLLNPLYQ